MYVCMRAALGAGIGRATLVIVEHSVPAVTAVRENTFYIIEPSWDLV